MKRDADKELEDKLLDASLTKVSALIERKTHSESSQSLEEQMREVLAAIVIVYATSLLPYSAAAQTTNSQQERMKLCNKQAGDQKLTGDARKTFMSDCLSGKTTSAKTLTPQQQKMKDCNLKATEKELKGEPRKAFMSSCLKGS